jgi:hypothetical protein
MLFLGEKHAGNLQIILDRFFIVRRGKSVIHNKSCFGRTCKQSQSNGHETDEKFYGNLNSVGKLSCTGIMYALYNTCKNLNGSSLMPDLNKSEYYGPNINPLTHHGYSSNPGNCWNQDWITEPWK